MADETKKVVTVPKNIQKAYDELKSQGFDVKLTDPDKYTDKEKNDYNKKVQEALKQLKELDK